MSTIRLPKTICLKCGATLNAIGDLEAVEDGSCRPNPGDPIACIRCGAVATIDDAGALRPFTEEEARELEADEPAMNELARLVRQIYIMRAAQN